MTKFLIFAVLSSLAFSHKAIAKGMFLPKSSENDYSYESSEASIEVNASAEAYSGTVASAGVFALYQDPRAGRGICMPPLTSNPQSVLNRNGIGYSVGRPSTAEISALAKGISQVERLLGRPLPASWRTNYNFINASGKWNQGSRAINVRRPVGSPKGTNVGRMMHELGHKVGNSGVYSRYLAAMKGKGCAITPYATKSKNECFAEVFEAYVTFPDLLRDKCPEAYKFFANELFPGSENVNASCRGSTAKTLLARVGNTRSRAEASESRKPAGKNREANR